MAKGFYSFETESFEFRPVRNGIGNVHTTKLLAPEKGDDYTIGYMIIPPGSSIGDHFHDLSDEETYIIIEGQGEMLLDDEKRIVNPGDVIVNAPGGKHGLKNTGSTNLKVVALDVLVPKK
jgi:quercetin dioxygenase-like cupin family protein